MNPLSEMDKDNKNNLGIFDYNSIALLPYEMGEFNFFEPRYKLMVQGAIEENDGWFILRGSTPTELDDGVQQASVLCRIDKHVEVESPNGTNIIVRVKTGNRVNVIEELEERMRGSNEGSLPLARASNVATLLDQTDAFDTDEATHELMEGVWQRLIGASIKMTQEHDQSAAKEGGSEDETNEEYENIAVRLGQDNEDRNSISEFMKRQAIQKYISNGLPPLDPEKFSFWALLFISGPQTHSNGVSERLNWLACQSTATRLRHCSNILQTYIDLPNGGETVDL